MNAGLTAPLFYFGTLISSIGSFTFNICLIAFMIKAGFSLGEASLIIGLQRLIPVIVTGIFGHHTDTLPPRLTVFTSEIIAGVSSLGLLMLWQGRATSYSVLIILCIVRSIVVAFQTGSRSKIAKDLSDSSYASNARNAIWFNKATQGAMLFSGLIAWFIIDKFSFEAAVIFDATTFVLNGVIIFLLPLKQTGAIGGTSSEESWTKKYFDLFKYSPRAAKLECIKEYLLGGIAP